MKHRLLHEQLPDSYLGGFDYTIEPYLGCNFGCRYCFVPERGRHETGQPVERWGLWRQQLSISEIDDVLTHHAGALVGARLCIAGATDAWQPAEAKYGLTRRVLDRLLQSDIAFIFASTRSPVIVRDIDLLLRFGRRVRVAISIGSDLDAVSRAVEPHAPSFGERLATIAALRDAGIDVRVSVAPLLEHSPRFFEVLMDLGLMLWLDMPDRRTPDAALPFMADSLEVVETVQRLHAQYGPDRISIGAAQFAGTTSFGEQS